MRFFLFFAFVSEIISQYFRALAFEYAALDHVGSMIESAIGRQ